MIIGNFSQLDLRLDKWALWENFLISERLKQNTYFTGGIPKYIELFCDNGRF
jgi:hypothetical protein